jgi:hypothetical protein
MSNRKRPTPQTRLLSHVIVGLFAGAVISHNTKASFFPIAAILCACAHEALDAPVAQVLTDLDA